jgi:hypothetical protein
MVSRHWSDRAYWFALVSRFSPGSRYAQGWQIPDGHIRVCAVGQLLRERHQGNMIRVTNYAATDILDRRNIYFCLEFNETVDLGARIDAART